MSSKRRLTRSQERRRIEGLRILARIIARHYLARPEVYPAPRADGAAPDVNGHAAANEEAVGREGEHGS